MANTRGNVKQIIDPEGRRCMCCGKFKSWENYHKSKCGVNGHVGRCKLCILDYENNRRKTISISIRMLAEKKGKEYNNKWNQEWHDLKSCLMKERTNIACISSFM